MDRKEFLITVWKKGVIPVMLLGLIFLCGKFLFNVFAKNGAERIVMIFVLGLGVIMLTAYLIELVFKSLTRKLHASMPESIKSWISVLQKFSKYISPILLGVIIYHFWLEDWLSATVMLGVVLIQRIVEIIKRERKRSPEI